MTFYQRDTVVISALWAFVAIDIAYADILSLYVPGVLPQVLQGTVEGVTLSAELMLLGAAFLQLPLLMMVLAPVMSPKLGRFAHLGAVIVTASFVVGGGSPKPHYLLIAACELCAMGTITWLAWRGPRTAWECGRP